MKIPKDITLLPNLTTRTGRHNLKVWKTVRVGDFYMRTGDNHLPPKNFVVRRRVDEKGRWMQYEQIGGGWFPHHGSKCLMKSL